MSRRVHALHKPPLLGYHVINKRGGGAVATPWYLAGGVSAANCIAAYQPIGAASYASSKVNLANPGTYDAVEGVAPDWDAANGWRFNGTNDYLNSGIVHTKDYTALARFIRRGTTASGTWIIYGANSVNTRFYLGLSGDEGDSRFNYKPIWGWGTSALNEPDLLTNVVEVNEGGVICSSGNLCYWDGVYRGIQTSTYTNTNSRTDYIGAYNNNGTTALYLQVDILALSVYNTTLTQPQVAAISAAMAALDGGAKSQSLEGLLSFEPEEETLWWQGADVQDTDILDKVEPQVVELTWWGKAKKYINDKLYQLWQAIEDYFDYHEEI